MSLPAFLVRKLYRRGSLRETADGRFAFTLHNPLGGATIIAPPRFTINGIRYTLDQVAAPIALAAISPDNPLPFGRGDEMDVSLPGRLLRGANRIHVVVETREFGPVDIFVEDQEADYCEMPGALEPGALEEE